HSYAPRATCPAPTTSTFRWPWSSATACVKVTPYAARFAHQAKRTMAATKVDAVAVAAAVADETVAVAAVAAATVRNSTHWSNSTGSTAKKPSNTRNVLNSTN